MSEPEHCPGVGSENAGKSSACDGCPNKGACSSGSIQADPEVDFYEIARKLESVKNIIIVMSGKGGVGKSTVCSQLARLVAKKYPESNVGLLDVDICGPSIPKAMGIENEEVYTSASGWSPIYADDNLAVMSCGFLLDSLDDAVIWRGPKKNGIIKQFLRDVDWGDLDYLFIDTPPGTSDEHISLVTYLKHCSNVRGAILVTTPQEIAQMDVRKQIDFCHRVKMSIIGIVENMSMFTCPKCHKESYIFKRSENSLEDLNARLSVPILGRIPLDPIIGQRCDEGKSLFENGEDGDKKDTDKNDSTNLRSKTLHAFENVWNNVRELITK